MIIKPPVLWDAKKFAERYRLDLRRDFYIDGEGMLIVLPKLPDDPPIFEAPDPPVTIKPVRQELDEIKARLDALESKAALKSTTLPK